MSTPMKGCGRLDVHDEHDWIRPALFAHPERIYHCPGYVPREGAYWADWDAEDDAREEAAIDDAREES